MSTASASTVGRAGRQPSSRRGPLPPRQGPPPPLSPCRAAAAGVSTFELGQTWGDWSLLVAVRPENVAPARAVLEGVDAGVRDVGALTANAEVLERAGQPWEGVDQERFSRTSWHGAGVEAAVAAMQERSRRNV